MLNSNQYLRIASLLRLFTWWLDMSSDEVDDLARRCENEARVAKQNEMIEEPGWMKDMPDYDHE